MALAAAAAVAAVIAAVAVVAWRRRSSRRRALTAVEAIDRLLAAGDFGAASDAAIAALATHAEPRLRVPLRRRLARVLVGTEEYAAACRVCGEAAEEAPDDEARAAAFLERARCFAAWGDFERAWADVDEAGRLPRSQEDRVALGLVAADCALFENRLDEAERRLAAVFSGADQAGLAPEVGLAHARLQFARGNFRQAIAEVGRVLEQLPGDDLQALALVTLARALLEQEHPDAVGADHALSRASVIAHQPGLLAVIAACHGVLQAHFKNFTEAETEAARASRGTVSGRYLAEAGSVAGDALFLAGRHLEARAAYQAVLAAYPAVPGALWGLARCAQAFGHFEVAESYFRLCVEAAPGHYLAARAEHELAP